MEWTWIRCTRNLQSFWENYISKITSLLDWKYKSTKCKGATGPPKFFWKEAGWENYSAVNTCYLSWKNKNSEDGIKNPVGGAKRHGILLPGLEL